MYVATERLSPPNIKNCSKSGVPIEIQKSMVFRFPSFFVFRCFSDLMHSSIPSLNNEKASPDRHRGRRHAKEVSRKSNPNLASINQGLSESAQSVATSLRAHASRVNETCTAIYLT
jgi:hypothetical protein